MRTTVVATLILAALSLGACSPSTKTAATAGGGDRYAGLDAEILTWRTDIKAKDKICVDPAHPCDTFEVACKGELPLKADDPARGVTTRLVAAITYSGWSKAGEKPGSAFANFVHDSKGWTRSEAKPVNLSTCAAS